MKPHFTQFRNSLRRLVDAVSWGVNDRLNHYRARLHRVRLSEVTFVAITGSAGKTTTKDLAAAVLAAAGATHKNHGTANQHRYLDDTVRGVTPHHKYSVLELSADRPGYLDRSLRLIRPQISVLTLIAREHYSAFRSLAAIAQEKGKLITSLAPEGVAVLNIDDPHVRELGKRHPGRIVWVGHDPAATIRLLECESTWPDPLRLRFLYAGQVHAVTTRMYGDHLAMPVALALGVGVAANIPIDNAIAAVAAVEPVEGRMQIKVARDGVVFLRDDWKAPQWSLHLPFAFVKQARAHRKIIVLGSISDSPKSPSQRYNQAAREALEIADLVVLIGPAAAASDKLRHKLPAESLKAFINLKDAAEFLKEYLRSGDLVLLKGTNKQDHLVRLVMDRYRPVQCWTNDCGIPRFCTSCERVYGPTTAPQEGSENFPELADPISPSSSPVIIGLGNQGTKYRSTPHNVGHLVVDGIGESAPGVWSKQPEGWVRSIIHGGLTVTLFKPAAPMNLCGPAVSQYLARTGRTPQDCIVVHDDMDLPIGHLRVKTAGGDAGHKGIRSLMIALGTNRFVRVRIGVRRTGDLRNAKELVLTPFARVDELALKTAIPQAESTVLDLALEMQKPRPPVAEAVHA